jgi:hypothetical protein
MPQAPSPTPFAKWTRLANPFLSLSLVLVTDEIITVARPLTLQGEKCENLVIPSAGVHIVLPDYYSPRDMGLLDPATSDGRVIFFLPWV